MYNKKTKLSYFYNKYYFEFIQLDLLITLPYIALEWI